MLVKPSTIEDHDDLLVSMENHKKDRPPLFKKISTDCSDTDSAYDTVVGESSEGNISDIEREKSPDM